jgi:uncharacterized protein YjdB
MNNVGYGYFITEETDYGPVDDVYTNIQFYSNVVIAHGTGDGGMWLGGAHELVNCEIKNNIFQNFNYGLKFKGTGGQSADYLYVQNNIFYNCSTQILWQSLTPTHYTNSGNQSGNPLFVSTSDFRLQAGSIGINAGLAVTPIMQSNTTDILGALIANPPEVGAYEYGGVTVIPVTSVTVSGTGGATTISTNGGTLQMIATVLPANATDKTVTWSVIDGTGHATISAGGLLTAATNGTVTVKAVSNG